MDLATSSSVATATTVNAYTTYSGIEKKAGWVYADIDDNGDNKWYYLVAVDQGKAKAKRNVPFNSIVGDHERALLINKKTYLFKANGEMIEGLYTIGTDLGSDSKGGKVSKAMAEGTYYFSKDSATKGQMLTGRQSVEEDGETYEYYFAKDGHAYKDTIVNDIVYGADGKRIQAEDGNKYQIFYNVPEYKGKDEKSVVVPAGSDIIINARGKIVKATAKVKSVKVDDAYYNVWVDEDGTWKCEYDANKNK